MNTANDINESAKPENLQPGDVLQTSHTMKVAAEGKVLGTPVERPDLIELPKDEVDVIPTETDADRPLQTNPVVLNPIFKDNSL